MMNVRNPKYSLGSLLEANTAVRLKSGLIVYAMNTEEFLKALILEEKKEIELQIAGAKEMKTLKVKKGDISAIKDIHGLW